MKTKLYQNALLCCALAVTAACSNDTEEALAEQQNAPQEVTLIASIGDNDTRTYVTFTNSDYNYNSWSYKTYWAYNDDIYVWGYKDNTTYSGTPYAHGILLEGSSYQQEGVFKGFIEGGGSVSNLQYALYPAPDDKSDDHTSFSFTLKHEYDYENSSDVADSYYDFLSAPDGITPPTVLSNAPMYCTITDAEHLEESNNITFSHLCGMVRMRLEPQELSSLNIYNMPDENEKDELLFTVTVTADKDIAGTAKVTFDATKNPTFKLAMDDTADNNSKTVTFKNLPVKTLVQNLSYDLDFPVPPGEDIYYKVTMTYPKYAETADGPTYTTTTATVYEGAKTVGVGEIWLMDIEQVTINLNAPEYSEIN